MMVLNQLPAFRNGSIESAADRLLNDAIQALNEWSQAWDPSCNVFESEDGFTVQIALPGFDPAQIDVKVENNVLSVKGGQRLDQSDGRKWYARGIQAGPFSCSFRLPDYADHEKCTASYGHGLLTITFPKREEAKPRQIMIQRH